MSLLAEIVNCRAIERGAIPELSIDDFQQAILDGVAQGRRVASLFATPASDGVRLNLVLADDQQARLHLATTLIQGASFDSLTPRCPQVHLFEREIAEQSGLQPRNHPWLKPVRFEHKTPAIGDTHFFHVEGGVTHEVAVGPVHAGIIEPGHFRFQCHGEEVLHLEISLGYQHRGVETALLGGPNRRSIHYAQTLAGDTTVGHATAYCQIIEALSGCQKPPRAQTLRAIALELERLANHVGDLGALSGDVGFLPTASYCGRIRGDFLNMTALLCGNRFGRDMIRPGGVGFDIDQPTVDDLLHRLDLGAKDCKNAIELLWDTQSVMARFEETGTVSAEMAQNLGLVGPAARASGLSRDVRQDQPWGLFRFAQIPMCTCATGDVYARAYVRWLEIQQSLAFVQEQLRALPGGEIRAVPREIKPNHLAVAMVEGWRGELCHVALTDANGRFERYKIVDPSFHNWMGLAMALRNQQISDFPLCNKSFNLSYCGHDL